MGTNTWEVMALPGMWQTTIENRAVVRVWSDLSCWYAEQWINESTREKCKTKT